MLIVDGKRIRISVKEDPNPVAEILRQFFTEDLKRERHKRITKEWVNTIP
jgi:hypothetical protein